MVFIGLWNRTAGYLSCYRNLANKMYYVMLLSQKFVILIAFALY